MSKKMLSQAIGVGLAVVTAGSVAPVVASAHISRHHLSDPVAKLAQLPEEVGDDEITVPEGTLVFSQTAGIAARVYNSDGVPRLNLYNKQTGMTEVRGVPVAVESTETGVTYRYAGDLYAGELTVEVAIATSGEQTITIDDVPQQTDETITGTVSYRPRIALPSDAVIDISLVDVSRADAPTITLSSQKIVSGGRQVPFPFTLLYDPEQISPGLSYAVQSRITIDGDLKFVTTTQFPVITNGHPNEVEVQVEPTTPVAAAEEIQLTSAIWQLEQIRYRDGVRLVPASPSNYTIEFTANGNLAIRADCNQVSGSYTQNDSGLTIELGPTTLAACLPESIDQDYLQALQHANIHFFENGNLFIDTKLNSSTMQFSVLD
ncbi:YbaY family lipoprotein [Leptolyngbya cf. ectocarpi LEGE 11479]|uniref:YbaY family lipoprotein n=1 Tax=Leptolyngbya cf. ectocarpi LEGE 11479 TaxID=1828722 RepID=A0A928X268_LEPEC|nr:YbaY family lipoprotein [Leptolyngbya ectocarpi]MBE9066411.1 YbaY family lipoprotein [Leptolyngbya cf. ectocarpi LEGE 11479]